MINTRTTNYLSAQKGIVDPTVNGMTVFIVDDDAAMRETLAVLLHTEGHHVECYASGTDFLDAWTTEKRGCMILDINLPQISGLDLQHKLSEQGIKIPIIFLTGFGDVPMTSAAYKAGAINFLEKPIPTDILIEGVNEALELSNRLYQNEIRQNQVNALYNHLTPREKEIIVFLAKGYSAKQVGRALGISHRTAEIHRARIMEKLGAQSLADLVALAIQMGVR
ncbi:MAG: response regulator transcription factor [Methylococcaceae bacterium]